MLGVTHYVPLSSIKNFSVSPIWRQQRQINSSERPQVSFPGEASAVGKMLGLVIPRKRMPLILLLLRRTKVCTHYQIMTHCFLISMSLWPRLSPRKNAVFCHDAIQAIRAEWIQGDRGCYFNRCFLPFQRQGLIVPS